MSLYNTPEYQETLKRILEKRMPQPQPGTPTMTPIIPEYRKQDSTVPAPAGIRSTGTGATRILTKADKQKQATSILLDLVKKHKAGAEEKAKTTPTVPVKDRTVEPTHTIRETEPYQPTLQKLDQMLKEVKEAEGYAKLALSRAGIAPKEPSVQPDKIEAGQPYTTEAMGRTVQVPGAPQYTPEDYEQWSTPSKLAYQTAAGATKTLGGELELGMQPGPEAETTGEHFAQFVGSIIPYVATSMAMGPIGAAQSIGKGATALAKALNLSPKAAQVIGKGAELYSSGAILGGSMSALRQSMNPEEKELGEKLSQIAKDANSFGMFRLVMGGIGAPIKQAVSTKLSEITRPAVMKAIEQSVNKGAIALNLSNIINTVVSSVAGSAPSAATVAILNTTLDYLKNPEEFQKDAALNSAATNALFFMGYSMLMDLLGVRLISPSQLKGWQEARAAGGATGAPNLGEVLSQHFRTLGLTKGASKTDVKNAYRDLARKYHPDFNPNNPQAQARFMAIKDAYEAIMASHQFGAVNHPAAQEQPPQQTAQPTGLLTTQPGQAPGPTVTPPAPQAAPKVVPTPAPAKTVLPSLQNYKTFNDVQNAMKAFVADKQLDVAAQLKADVIQAQKNPELAPPELAESLQKIPPISEYWYPSVKTEVAAEEVEAPVVLSDTGNTGQVVRQGDWVVKNATNKAGKPTEELAILKELQGIEGVPEVREQGDQFVIPYFKRVISVDTVPKGERGQYADIVMQNNERINTLINELNKRGISYSDQLQFGIDESGKAYLIDFSNAQKTLPEDARENNYSLWETFKKLFIPVEGETYTYYLTQRPPAPGAIPKGVVDTTSYDQPNEYGIWGTVQYSKPLSDQQIRDYELLDDKSYDARIFGEEHATSQKTKPVTPSETPDQTVAEKPAKMPKAIQTLNDMASDNPHLQDVKYDYLKEDTIKNLPKEELAKVGYKDQEAGQYKVAGYREVLPDGTKRIVLGRSATKDTVVEETAHILYEKLGEIDPALLKDIQQWEDGIIERAKRSNMPYFDKGEMFAKVYTFAEMGYGKDAPDIAKRFRLPKDLVDRFNEYMGASIEGKNKLTKWRGKTPKAKTVQKPAKEKKAELTGDYKRIDNIASYVLTPAKLKSKLKKYNAKEVTDLSADDAKSVLKELKEEQVKTVAKDMYNTIKESAGEAGDSMSIRKYVRKNYKGIASHRDKGTGEIAESEEYAELPLNLKLSRNKGGYYADEIADELGITENQLMGMLKNDKPIGRLKVSDFYEEAEKYLDTLDDNVLYQLKRVANGTDQLVGIKQKEVNTVKNRIKKLDKMLLKRRNEKALEPFRTADNKLEYVIDYLENGDHNITISESVLPTLKAIAERPAKGERRRYEIQMGIAASNVNFNKDQRIAEAQDYFNDPELQSTKELTEEQLLEFVNHLRGLNNNPPIKPGEPLGPQLSLEELDSLIKGYSAVVHNLVSKDKLIRQGKLQERKDAITTVVRDAAKVNKGSLLFTKEGEGSLEKFFRVEQLQPETITTFIQGKPVKAQDYMFDKNLPELYNYAYEDFNRGMSDRFKIIQDVYNDINFMQKQNVTKDSLLLNKKTKNVSWQQIKLDSGKTIEMSPAEMMTVYLYNKNEHAKDSLIKGGIRTDKHTTDWAEKTKHKLTTVYEISENDIQNIINQLTAEQKARADKFFEIVNTKLKDGINKTSEELVGYAIASVENYWPIFHNRDYDLKQQLKVRDQDFITQTLEDLALLKPRGEAGVPVYVQDVYKVFMRYMNQSADYSSLAIPYRNAQQIVNDPIFKSNIDKLGMQSYREALGKYLDDVATLRRNANSNLENWSLDLLGKFQSAALGLSIWVPPKQLASYVLANTEIPVKYLTKAGTQLVSKDEINEIVKYSSQNGWLRFERGAMSREMGEIGEIGMPLWFYTGKTLGPQKYTGLIKKGDQMAVSRIWKAVKLWVNEERPDLKGEDYMHKVAEIYDFVVNRTQPTYLPHTRSAVHRSNTVLLRSIGMFMTQRNKNANMLLRNYIEYENSGKNSDDKIKFLHNLLMVVAASPLILMGIDEVRSALKRENLTLADRITKFIGYTLGNFYIMGDIVEGVYGRIKYGKYTKFYDTTNPVYQLIDDSQELAAETYNLVSQVVKDERYKSGALKGEPKWTKTAMRTTFKLMDTISPLTGYPLRNLRSNLMLAGRRISPEMELFMDTMTAAPNHTRYYESMWEALKKDGAKSETAEWYMRLLVEELGREFSNFDASGRNRDLPPEAYQEMVNLYEKLYGR